MEGAQLIPAEGEPAIAGQALETLLLAFARAREAAQRNAHRFDAGVLEALVDFVPLDAAHAPTQADVDALTARLNQSGLGKPCLLYTSRCV